jgi:hypothetical protein
LIDQALAPTTPDVSIHVQGMQWVKGTGDDGSYVGRNKTSLVDIGQQTTYTLFAEEAGTFLLYTMGDTSTAGGQLEQGLFGAVNVQPATAEWYRSQVDADDFKLVATGPPTAIGQPTIPDYGVLYGANFNPNGQNPALRASCTPILKMLDFKYVAQNGKCVQQGNDLHLYHSDLTAIITGPKAGRFAGTTGPDKPEPPCDAASEASPTFNPLFCTNPASPDRKQPYREVTVIYHEVAAQAVQAFFELTNADQDLGQTTPAGRDNFAINYGTGGIGAEIVGNRFGVGPMGSCIDCKFEEFFLSAWTVGDPAMVVDTPANSNTAANHNADAPCTTSQLQSGSPPCVPNKGTTNPPNFPQNTPYSLTGAVKATKVFYPDDPSNVYHSYLNDHAIFRILHGGTLVSHVHHQHAHQWLQSPNSDEGAYLDSQMISPGASYTLEMVYNGSGNRNKTVGDSIFHCHFYPHFAAGMWAMWRVHDVFEAGTSLDKDGKPVLGQRALPDGEIQAGTPIPAIVPLPTRPMPLMPSPVFIQAGQVVYGTPGTPDPDGKNVKENPGFPFFIPGHAGDRAPHPPFDFAVDAGKELNGGLPRHLITGGTITNEHHTKLNWSKDFGSLIGHQLPEDGTHVEKVAIDFFKKRCHQSFLPSGSSTNPVGPLNYPAPECPAPNTRAYFIVNGLPNGPQPGAPFADPAVDDRGKPVGKPLVYKAAAFQLDVTFNYLTSNLNGQPRQPGWHFPQERMLALWQDVAPTLRFNPFNTGAPNARQPEPLFFRANSKEDFIEYWHTNLIPNYYQVDDFQVRTPTDIIGQHIHLVKFDVTSSDGAANGFNYEDGTYSPDEVQAILKALQAPGGSWTGAPLGPPTLPAGICGLPNPPQQCSGTEWLGAQTTIQRWWPDPLVDSKNVDRTVRTVFTHDHFGPSTHQQVGLYAGLIVEPDRSQWRNPETGKTFGRPGSQETRPDGGPTSWKADILTANPAESYREFCLEFQDFALAYAYTQGAGGSPQPSQDQDKGFIGTGVPVGRLGTPQLVSTGNIRPLPGTETVNYMSEPIYWRAEGNCDLSKVFLSDCVRAGGQGGGPVGDPKTPLMRAYENDHVQVRFLVGAHVFTHFFTMTGPKWFFEPSWTESGYRSSIGNGLSEHFELLFKVPPSSKLGSPRKCPDTTSPGDCVDYLYSPSYDDAGMSAGMWGIFRAYDPTKPANNLKPLPNNPLKAGSNPPPYNPCPGKPNRTFDITAVTVKRALAAISPDPQVPPDPGQNPPAGQLVFNDKGAAVLRNYLGIMYVFNKDLDGQGRLVPGTPVEPLVLRAAAGDCIQVNLTNGMPGDSQVFKQYFQLTDPFADFKLKASPNAGLSPQLVAFDGATSSGMNVGYNQTNQAIGFGDKITYTWYAGKVDRDQNGALHHTPLELGSANLFPADPLLQHINAMYGSIIIEPAGSTWKCDKKADGTSLDSFQANGVCDPSDAGYAPGQVATRASATVSIGGKPVFREFVIMMADDLLMSQSNNSAVNYKTDPTFYRYGNPNPFPNGPPSPGEAQFLFAKSQDDNCAISDALVNRDPVTPIFGAEAGIPARFRLVHPEGTGAAQVFTLNGHIWQREPYVKNSAQIGNNKESQFMGSHDSYGSTDHFDLVVEKSGGKAEVPGDYLYSLFVPWRTAMGPAFGLWGVFRVVPKIQGGVPQVQPMPSQAEIDKCKADGAKPAKAQPKAADDPARFTRGAPRPVNP